MLLAKIKEKLFNRRNKVEVEDVEVNGEIPASIKALIEGVITPLLGTSFKAGIYYYNSETGKFECGERVPEDYTGMSYYIGDDLFEFNYFENGSIVSTTSIGGAEIQTPNLNADNINFASLTHSFNELDPALKAIIDDALADAVAQGVACTHTQWGAIKVLLNKSLYFNYDNVSMIKVCQGIEEDYEFFGFGGAIYPAYGHGINIYYSLVDNLLYIETSRV